MRKISLTEKQTFKIAEDFAKRLNSGGVIGLIGDLGAGKTVFVKGLARGLKIKQNISSPTFVLMRVYKTTNPKIERLVHVDAYRIKKARSLKGIGLDDYLDDEKTLVVIEWANLVKEILPKNTKFIILEHRTKGRVIFLPSLTTRHKKVLKPRQQS